MRMPALPRRAFLALLPGLWASGQQGVEARPRAGQGDVGELFNPNVAGRPRVPTVAGDNDARIQAIEQKLGCTCGCTLDIFTCRTTDFTCTYSPALHREVMALVAEGKGDPEVIEAFVEKYGEKILMAPKPRGFNMAGYMVPGILILFVGLVLVFVLRRRMGALAGGRAGGQAGRVEPTDPGTGGTPEELEELERALKEIDA